MHTAKIILLLVVAGCIAVFTFQNTTVIEVTFLIWSLSMSVSLMLLAALFSGIIFGMILSFINHRRKHRKPDAYGVPEG